MTERRVTETLDYVVQLDTSTMANGTNWSDETVFDDMTDALDRATVVKADYPHRGVRVIRRSVHEQVVHTARVKRPVGPVRRTP